MEKREFHLYGKTADDVLEDAMKKGIRGRFVMLAWPPLRDSEAWGRLRAFESDRLTTFAVRLFPDDLQTTKAYDEYLERYFRFVDNAAEFDAAQTIHGLSATGRTCKSCASHISLEYVRGESCPVCGSDLRSNTVQKTIERWKERIAKVREQGEEQARKAGWLGSWAAVSVDGRNTASSKDEVKHEALLRKYDSRTYNLQAQDNEELLYLPKQLLEALALQAKTQGLSTADYLATLVKDRNMQAV